VRALGTNAEVWVSKCSLIIATAIMACCAVVVFLLRNSVGYIYTNDAAVVEIGLGRIVALHHRPSTACRIC
jgi:hypothetical protein